MKLVEFSPAEHSILAGETEAWVKERIAASSRSTETFLLPHFLPLPYTALPRKKAS